MACRKPERDYKDRIAKRLCYILRYGAITEGLTVHEGGMSSYLIYHFGVKIKGTFSSPILGVWPIILHSIH